MEGEADQAGPTSTPPDGELRSLVAGLPERQRTALFLRCYADLDYDAIAGVLGVRRGTVSALLQAHRSVRRALALEEGR